MKQENTPNTNMMEQSQTSLNSKHKQSGEGKEINSKIQKVNLPLNSELKNLIHLGSNFKNNAILEDKKEEYGRYY